MGYTRKELADIIGTPLISQNLITGEVTYHTQKPNIDPTQKPKSTIADVFIAAPAPK